MKPVRFHSAATAELDDAARWYEERLEGLGQDLLSEIARSLELIPQLPALHSVYKNTGFRKCVLRRFPFNIFYAEREEYIWVIAVAHHKRRPDYWAGRTEE